MHGREMDKCNLQIRLILELEMKVGGVDQEEYQGFQKDQGRNQLKLRPLFKMILK